MRKLTRKSKLVITVGVGSAVLVIGCLPLLFLTLPNPAPVKIPGLEGEISGTYIVRQDGVFRLYPYTAPPAEFPAEALVVDERPRIVIKYRQMASLSDYGVWTWSGNQRVVVDKDTTSGQLLELVPQTDLAPGDYYVAAARDSIYGGVDYFYFRVKESGQIDGSVASAAGSLVVITGRVFED